MRGSEKVRGSENKGLARLDPNNRQGVGVPPLPTGNPFLPTFGTSPPLLAGRDREVSRLARALSEGPRHPDFTLLITGSRGSGKTVLLNEAEDLAYSHGWRVISVSAPVSQLIQHITSAGLQLLREDDMDGGPTRRISAVQAFGVGVSWGEGSGADYTAPHDLRDILTILAKRLADARVGLLLTVDELHGLRLSDARELAIAVQHITRRELLPMAFVGAALPEIESTILNDRGMTFFQRCARAPLQPLDPSAARIALLRPIMDAGREVVDEALDVMVKASAGHPFTIQLLGYHSWQAAFEDRQAPRIEIEHVREATREADLVELDQIVKPVWSGLSAMDRSFLAAMALDADTSNIGELADRMDRSPNYAQHYRRRLITAGLIESAGRGRVRFVHRATRDWLSNLGYDVAK